MSCGGGSFIRTQAAEGAVTFRFVNGGGGMFLSYSWATERVVSFRFMGGKWRISLDDWG